MKSPRFIIPLIFFASILLPQSTNAQLQWTVVAPAPTSNNLTSVAYGNGQYVAVGNSGTILTLSDGTAWTLQTWSCDTGTRFIPGLSSVTYGNGRYAAVGAITRITKYEPGPTYYYYNYPMSSSDGITWVGQAILSMTTLGFVTYSNGTFTSFASDAPVLIQSADGLSWAYYSGLGSCNWFTYQNGHYVFVSGSGSINVNRFLNNLSGIAVRFSGTTRKLKYIIYSAGQFVVVGDSGTILTSPDDSIWTIRPTGINANLKSVTYGNGQYVTVGASGTILNSPDGISWAPDSSGTTDSLNSVTTDGAGRFVAVGNNGTIVISGFSSLLPAPVLVSPPASAAQNQPVSLPLIWTSVSGATRYHVQVSTNNLFSNLILEDTAATDTSISLSGLTNSTNYYWRVRAKNDTSGSYWAQRYFATIIAAPATPTLVSPANGTLDQPITPTMRWGTAARAASYHLQISTDSAFTVLVKEDSSLIDTMVAISILSDSTTYYWRLRAKNAGGAGAWSTVWTFETGTTGVLPRPYALPRVFSISGSYGMIRYSLASACHVSLKYYDLRGRLVASLINATQGAGYYVLSVKDALPSRGTYIRVFEAGSFIKRDLTAVVGK